MAFDPAIPANGSPNSSAEMRSQFTGLFDLIQSIPVGPAGPPSVNAAVIDGVTTGNPGETAVATVALDAGTLHFSFSIPRGEMGGQGVQGIQGGMGPVGPAFTSFLVESVTSLDPAQPATVTAVFDGTSVKLAFGIPGGQPGLEGPQGIMGSTGATGPAFTSFVIDSVTTLEPFQPATVSASFDGTNVKLAFGIPRGFAGNDGTNGLPGPQGVPGEVTLAALNAAIATTSSTSNAVVDLPSPYADPDAETLRQKLNELIEALRR